LAQLKTVKKKYRSLYNEKSNLSEKQDLIQSIELFLVSHASVSCKEGINVHNPSTDMSNLLNDLKGEERALTKSNVVMSKVIYGDDDRVEVSETGNELFKKLAKSTAAMIKNSKISKDFKLSKTTLAESFNLCDGEKFKNQINPASCSGFLVAPDIMVTAGHCLKTQFDCENSKWVFDFTTNQTQLKSTQIFSCKNIIERKLVSNGADYAVFKIDRKISDRKPLKFRKSGVIEKNQNIVVIGHPSGLPTKISAGAIVKDQSSEDFFVTNLDTFGGNSGSAVFNVDTGYVEGILVRGETDYVLTVVNGKSCRKVNKCKADECRGEDVTKITSVEGLPRAQVPDKEITMKAILDGTINLKMMGGKLSYFGVDYEGYLIGGRKFLDLCGLQVSTTSSPNIWLAETLTICEKKQDLLDVYSKFEDLINF
jgi:V8-like Glu-specific endopeptidase